MLGDTESYHIDFKYLEQNPIINEINVIDYFRTHPEYDPNCINEKIKQGFDVGEEKEGIWYSYEFVHEGFIVIKKERLKAEGKKLPLGYYIVVGDKIFNCPNFKDVLKAKIENIANLINLLGEELMEPL